jgi:hypothetical protein
MLKFVLLDKAAFSHPSRAQVLIPNDLSHPAVPKKLKG